MNEGTEFKHGGYVVKLASYAVHDGKGNVAGWIPQAYFWTVSPAPGRDERSVVGEKPVATKDDADRIAATLARKKIDEG